MPRGSLIGSVGWRVALTTAWFRIWVFTDLQNRSTCSASCWPLGGGVHPLWASVSLSPRKAASWLDSRAPLKLLLPKSSGPRRKGRGCRLQIFISEFKSFLAEWTRINYLKFSRLGLCSLITCSIFRGCCIRTQLRHSLCTCHMAYISAFPLCYCHMLSLHGSWTPSSLPLTTIIDTWAVRKLGSSAAWSLDSQWAYKENPCHCRDPRGLFPRSLLICGEVGPFQL